MAAAILHVYVCVCACVQTVCALKYSDRSLIETARISKYISLAKRTRENSKIFICA